MFGLSEADILGRPLQDLLVEDEREAAKRALLGGSVGGEYMGLGSLSNHTTLSLLIRSVSFHLPAISGWMVIIYALDGYHLLRELINNPLFQHFMDRAFIGFRAVEFDARSGQHRLVFTNEAALNVQAPSRDEAKSLNRNELMKIARFWEQGKEVQPMPIAQTLVTHYHGMFSIKRSDGKDNFSKYVTCEAATLDRQRNVRIGFEWDITDKIAIEKETGASTVSMPDGGTPIDANATWLDVLPIPALLIDESGDIAYSNPLASARFNIRPARERKSLLDLISSPWHVNVSSFLECSLSATHTSRNLRCNMVDVHNTSFPAELLWRQILYRGAIHHLVLMQDLSETQVTARVIEKLAEHDRCRFGQELHDFIGQNASAISIILSTLRMNKSIPVELQDAIQSAEDAARNILAKARHLSRGLLAHSIGLKGLVAALKDLSEEMEKLRDWECYVTACEMPTIRRDIAISAYRIAREAAENALRYSGAAVLSFRLHQTEQWLYLTVEDNGCGLPKDFDKRGSGMASMKQTAFSMGGCVTISTRPEGGVRIVCAVPINS